MFVRKKKNKSGTTSVQVIAKTKRRSYKLIKSIGCSRNDEEIEKFYKEGVRFVKGPSLFDDSYEEAFRYDEVFTNIYQNQLRLVGPEYVFGVLFDKIGYNQVKTSKPELFRALVVTRLYRPASKLRTSEYLSRFMHKQYSPDVIYKYLDELCTKKQKPFSESDDDIKWQVEQVSFEHTKRVVGGEVRVVFYDTTTMYFESREDDIRIPGYSKDGKHANPQIVFGLLVGTGGNPIGYEIHKGNQYEGTTLIPIIRKLQKRFNLSKPTVIADAGLLNKANLDSLETEGYKYILGGRIRSLSKKDKDAVLALGLKNNEAEVVMLGERKLVVSMSDKRAIKDAKEREKGIKGLEKKYLNGNITKKSLNNRGYNRFLSLSGGTTVEIDLSKIEEDKRFDGLKGYITNSDLNKHDIIENYRYLFMIERAFRFNKTDLDIRPMYHRLMNRIEAHVCICFVAYTIMLELERTLAKAGSTITLHRAMFLTEGIYEITYINPYNKKQMAVLLKTDHDQEVTELLELVKM